MSIPYDKGWSAYVDGKKTELIPVIDHTFMALKLEEGEHDIVLEYSVPGGREGIYLTICGIIMLIVLTIWNSKKIKMT